MLRADLGVALFARARRLFAAAAVLALLTTFFAASPTIETPASAQPAAPVFDEEAAAERLWFLQMQRASRNYFTSGLGSVDTRTVAVETPTRSQPRQPKTVKPAAPPKKAAAPPAKKPTKPPTKKPAVKASGNLAVVVNYAIAQIGRPYVFAAEGPTSFDCSGLVRAAYLRIGISLPHQTGALSSKGRPVSRADLRPGDLVFPSSGHVMIYVGDGMVVHASNPRDGVKKSTIYAFAYARRIVG